MEDESIRHLEAALSSSPDDKALLGFLLQAYVLRNDLEKAYKLIKHGSDSQISEQSHRRLAANVCLKMDDAESALRFSDGNDAETLIVRANVLLALGRHRDGLEAYDAAVEQNSALEDQELRKLLKVKIKEVQRDDGGPALKVIANDDTDEADILRILRPIQDKVGFSDVGGLEDVKKKITKKIITPFKKPSLYKRFRKRAGGGILLYGPPGCGKTLLARATAGEVDAEFFAIEIADVLDMYMGESERKLHAIFEKARADAPAVLFFDEVEALGGKRQFSRQSTAANLVSQFLAEMDGFAQNNQGVLILGATNVPWAVDPAFRRPGRFDRLVFIPPPDFQARRAIIKLELENRPVSSDVDVEYLAKHTSGYSGADLNELVGSAVDEAIEDSIEANREIPLNMKHLKAALNDLSPTTLEWLTTARNYARYANESGQYNEVLQFLTKHGKQ